MLDVGAGDKGPLDGCEVVGSRETEGLEVGGERGIKVGTEEGTPKTSTSTEIDPMPGWLLLRPIKDAFLSSSMSAIISRIAPSRNIGRSNKNQRHNETR